MFTRQLLFSCIVFSLQGELCPASTPTWILEEGHWFYNGSYDSYGKHRDVSDVVARFKYEKENQDSKTVEQTRELFGEVFLENEHDDEVEYTTATSSTILKLINGQRPLLNHVVSQDFTDSRSGSPRKHTPIQDPLQSKTNKNIKSRRPTKFRRRHLSKTTRLHPGPNGPASERGGFQIWKNLWLYNTLQFANQESINSRSDTRTLNLERRRPVRDVNNASAECCAKVLISSNGTARNIQWDRMGVYTARGDTVQGRMVYTNEDRTQSLYYVYGEFNGWMLGPNQGMNYGGVKSSHSGLCVHQSQSGIWSYYGGPSDTRDPQEAFPHWKQDDASLSVSCVPRSVNIHSRRIPDDARAPLLLNLYREIRPILLEDCGSQLSSRLNIDAWTVKLDCGGSCHRSNITVNLVQGQADLLMLHSREEGDITEMCIRCSYWAARLNTGETASWSTLMSSRRMYLFIIITGYTEYISLNINIASQNIIRASPQLYTISSN